MKRIVLMLVCILLAVKLYPVEWTRHLVRADDRPHGMDSLTKATSLKGGQSSKPEIPGSGHSGS